MSVITLHLEPTPWTSLPAADFTFDPETQEIGGPDGGMMREIIAGFRRSGFVQPIPCANWPIGERLTLLDLTAIIAALNWEVSPELPLLPAGWWGEYDPKVIY